MEDETWTPEEDAELLSLFKARGPLHSIAWYLRRTEDSVIHRLQSLGKVITVTYSDLIP